MNDFEEDYAALHEPVLDVEGEAAYWELDIEYGFKE